MARHPNDQRLLAWLEGADTGLDEHVSECQRCAEVLDRLATSDADLRPALLSVLTPPADLADRVSERLAVRVQNRRDVELLGSLLGVPIEAGRVVLEPGEQPR